MNWCVGSLVPVLAILASVAQGILIIGPRRIYRNEPYTLVVSNFLDHSVDLSLSLESTEDNNVTHISTTKIVDVQSNTNKLIDFSVPQKLPYGNYRISINGIRGFNYHEDVPVVVESKPIAGLIQLDKPLYEPGDIVNFRVVVLDSDLKPPKNLSYVTVAIETPAGISMRQWDNAPLEIGVFAGSFLIPPAPVLGIYKIVVESDGNELVSKTFEVQEYVLSGINVDVFPTRVPLEEHQGVDLTVSAKDVYGEPVRGKIELALFEGNTPMNVNANHEVDGIAQFTIPFKNQLHIYDDFNEICLKFTFTSTHTNRTIIRSVPITIFKSMYRVKLIKESPEFRPGYPFKATVKIEHHDGSPASSVKCLVKVISSEEHEFKRDSNDNGDIPLQLTPAVNDDVITVKVSVEDQDLLEEEIQKAAFNNTPILEIAQQSSTRINKPIKLKVICGDDVKFLIYYVIAKGTVIDQGYMRITQRNNVNIDIQYSASMVPKATVFVMTIAGDMMVYDTMDIIYDEQLNNILLEIEDIQVQPGGQVELNVRGQQGSYVALAAYDKRLQEYGSTHDISWKDMEILYDQFNGIEKNEFDILKNYGLFARVSTNIKINSAARHGGRDDSFKNPTEYRQYFAESFLWKNLSLQHSDQITLVERIPDTMTSWYITGFAVHPEYGFGIVKQPIEFTTKKSFYIVDHLPHSIKRGEEVELQFTIFNGNKDAEVNVQLLNVFDQLDFVGELSSESGQIKSVVTQPNVGASVSFHVKAKKLGEIVVRVVASNMHDRDAIEKVVRVMPESLMNRGSESRLFQSTSYMNQSFKMSPKIHRHADADSTKITFKLEPHPLAEVFENLGGFTNLPRNRGSPNLLLFALNVGLLDLQKGLGQNFSIADELKNFLALCYHNQLKYRLQDGAIADTVVSNSSIFITAFVANVMQNSAKYLPEVDEIIIREAFDWLASKQHISGRFEEIGPVVLEDLQTNARESIALTSYVLIAFLENPYAKQNHSRVIEKSIGYILEHRNEIKDSLDLAIATYALSLHDSVAETTPNFVDKLIERKKVDGHMYWPSEVHSILSTVYASLVLAPNKDFNHNVLMTMLSVVKQRPANSFSSVMGTLFGLNAIAKLAKFLSPLNNEYQVTIKSFDRTWKYDFTSRDNGAIILKDIPSDIRNMQIDVVGNGVGLFTMEYEYLVDLRNYKRQFDLSLEKLAPRSNDELKLKVCVRYRPELTNARSNMALVEVNLPSGYVADNNPISMTTGDSSIEHVATSFGATTVIVYYGSVGSEPNCFVVTAYKRSRVSLKLPAYVLVQEFYEPTKTAIEAYNIEHDD